MNLQQINPFIRHAAHSRIRPPMHINRRIILDYELLYVESGDFLLCYGDNTYRCRTGDILLLCPGIPHSFHITEAVLQQPHIHFDLCYDALSPQIYICFQDLNQLPEEHKKLIRENVFSNTSPFLHVKDPAAFRELFYSIIDHKDPLRLDCRAQMLCLLQMILEDTPSTIVPGDASVPDLVPRIRSYIDSNYHQPVNLDALEAMFHYSKFYIEKLFVNTYGISIIRYRNQKRLEAAPALLRQHSVTDCASLLGYSSVYSFSRAFRQAYGISPTRYNTIDK